MAQHSIDTQTALEVRRERRNEIDRFFVSGRLDVFTAPVLQREIDTVAHPDGALILDFDEVTSMDKFGLRSVERAALYASREGWHLGIVNCPRSMRELFTATGNGHLLIEVGVSDSFAAGDKRTVIALPSSVARRRGGSQDGRV